MFHGSWAALTYLVSLLKEQDPIIDSTGINTGANLCRFINIKTAHAWNIRFCSFKDFFLTRVMLVSGWCSLYNHVFLIFSLFACSLWSQWEDRSVSFLTCRVSFALLSLKSFVVHSWERIPMPVIFLYVHRIYQKCKTGTSRQNIFHYATAINLPKDAFHGCKSGFTSPRRIDCDTSFSSTYGGCPLLHI